MQTSSFTYLSTPSTPPPQDCWDALDIQLVHDACNPAASADLAAVLITDGLANLLLIGSACTVVKAKIESTLPRKRGAALAGYEKAVEKFFTKVWLGVSVLVGWWVGVAHRLLSCSACTVILCVPRQ